MPGLASTLGVLLGSGAARSDNLLVLLRPFGDSLWIADGDRVRMLGIPFCTRMTVARLADGSLWLHSPVSAHDPLVAEVEALGPVRHVVAPNKFHHLFVADWLERFPYATTWAGPQLADRVSLRFDHELGDETEACWAQDLDQLIFCGSKVLDEAVFFHRKSRALIVTDIIQNHEPDSDGWFWRTVKRLNGILAPDGGVPKDWQMTVRDHATARAARDRLLAWDFERLVLAHGRCVEDDAHAFVERAFTWLDEQPD
jgi:hypothetical protein